MTGWRYWLVAVVYALVGVAVASLLGIYVNVVLDLVVACLWGASVIPVASRIVDGRWLP